MYSIMHFPSTSFLDFGLSTSTELQLLCMMKQRIPRPPAPSPHLDFHNFDSVPMCCLSILVEVYFRSYLMQAKHSIRNRNCLLPYIKTRPIAPNPPHKKTLNNLF